MTCAACAARVERKLGALDDVTATVNLATEKATVIAPPSVPVQRLIEAGYEAELAGHATADNGDAPRGADADRVRYLQRRLIIALVFFIPLSDLSVLLSLFPAFRFPGWQWVLVVLAAPVAGWAAWPFHSAALKNARHGSTSMDTLVSLGIVAACGWSVYAMFVLDSGAVAGLRNLGLRTVLLTGDSQAVARAVAVDTGVDDVIAEALPGDKAAVVRRLQAEGRRVAVAGDGINDGPALAAADLGLALGSGTDVAISAADLIVLREDLAIVPQAISLARATLATIRRNLAWAFSYNVLAIPVAAAGFLNPLIAGAAMAASSAFVVANSVRLRRFAAAPSGRRGARPQASREPAVTSGDMSGQEVPSCPA